jgi:hypothetical protein
MGSRKKKDRRKKHSRTPRTPFGHLPFPTAARIVVEPPGVKKLSQVLVEFIEPYADLCTDDNRFGRIISVAVVAWNAACYSGSKRTEFLQKMLQLVPPEGREGMASIVAEMIERKERYYADDRRFVVSYQVIPTPQGRQLGVMSTRLEE